MPTMPAWATGGRIVYDTEYALAYIRVGRRAVWTVWTVCERPSASPRLVQTKEKHRVLGRARTAALEATGASVGAMVRALHPAAAYVHASRQKQSLHDDAPRCGAPSYFRTTYGLATVTCPACLAVTAEDLVARAKVVGVEKVESSQLMVRATRETNALSKLVVGETMTGQDV